jgi:simple sugar transport system ATP-binding protein
MACDNKQKPLLQAEHISKWFGNVNILDDVSFQIFPGEIIGLMGENGAGKSTLVKIITGYYSPSKGNLYWQGNPLNYRRSFGPIHAYRIGIQTVYQQLGLIENLSLWRNFFLGNELVTGHFPFRRLDVKQMQQITQQQLTDFGVDKTFQAQTRVSDLSGGERQALAICRAKYFKPKLLILDEPTSALSKNRMDSVLKSIKSVADAGIAVIYICHQREHLQAVAKEILYLDKGALVARKVCERNQIKTEEYHAF